MKEDLAKKTKKQRIRKSTDNEKKNKLRTKKSTGNAK